jgi:hypothetical protein
MVLDLTGFILIEEKGEGGGNRALGREFRQTVLPKKHQRVEG